MGQITYQDMVRVLKKSPDKLVEEFTPVKADLMHMACGISSEAGELLDAVKKCVIYNKPLNIENVIEELGNMEFYLEGLRQTLLITRDLIIDHNKNKLGKRYDDFTYSDQAAHERADKKNGE